MHNNLVFAKSSVSKFRKISVLTHDAPAPWVHYENAHIYIATDYVLISVAETKTQILLPRESIKVITTEEKIW